MIEVNAISAKYFDNCDECGEVIDHDTMYVINVDYSSLRLCYKCTRLLRSKLGRALDTEELR